MSPYEAPTLLEVGASVFDTLGRGTYQGLYKKVWDMPQGVSY